MDFIVELPPSQGHTVIWTVIDLFSKQAHFLPCKSLPSAHRLARLFVHHIYRLHGVPKRIISDRGVQFTARFWRNFLRCIGSAQGLSSAYHPSTNGAAERANAMVERYLRAYVSYLQNDWCELLPFAEAAYNNAPHRSTGFTPFRIVSGQEFPAIPDLDIKQTAVTTPSEWADRIQTTWPHVKKALEQASVEYKRHADKRRVQGPPLRVGDKVYLATKYLRLQLPSKKLGPKYIGPFPIRKVINPVTVELELPPRLGKVHPVFHASLLKPAIGIREPHTWPGPVAGEQYEIRDIMDSRYSKGTLKYLVRWRGYPDSEASWVRCNDVLAPRLIRRFHKTYPHKPGGPVHNV